MAAKETSSPKRGKKTKAELRTELEERDRLEKASRESNRILLAGSIIGLLALMALGTIVVLAINARTPEGPDVATKVVQEKELAIANHAVPPGEPGPHPFTKKGVRSFKEWMTLADKRAEDGNWGWWESVMGLHDLSYTEARNLLEWHVANEERGKSYVKVVGRNGLGVINTRPKSGHYSPFRAVLTPGDKYLGFDPRCPYLKSPVKPGDGVRMGCGNAIRGLRTTKVALRVTKKAPPKRARRKQTRNKPKGRDPYGSHRKPGHPVYRSPPARPSPKYKPGNAEHVARNRGPAHGYTGSGSGSNSAGEQASDPTNDPDDGIAGETSDGETGDVQ